MRHIFLTDTIDIDRLPSMKGFKGCGIYCIFNTLNKSSYFGQSVRINARYNQHTRTLRNCVHRNKGLQQDYAIDPSAFLFVVLESCTPGELNDKEQYWIDLIETKYNEILWSDRRTFSEIHRKKLSLAHIGNRHTEEAKRKIGQGSKGNNYKKGIKWSDEERKNRVGKMKHGIVNGFHPMRGKKRNPASIKKGLQTKIERYGRAQMYTKSVALLDSSGAIIHQFDMVKQACQFLGISHQTFSRAVKKERGLFEKYPLKYI